MIPNPILKVLSTMRTHRVQSLLMGGQACILYGAAEFSRDTDLAILAEPANIERLRAALKELDASQIALPPLNLDYLKRGHGVHFRCHAPDVTNMRIDVMSVMRGVEPFDRLWLRRTTVDVGGSVLIELMSLPDLVQAKRTQRDKDWLMIRRLIEAHYVLNRRAATPEHVAFWLRECRTAEILVALCSAYPAASKDMPANRRIVLQAARAGDERGVDQALLAEEAAERELDRNYWLPLKRELEQLRHTDH